MAQIIDGKLVSKEFRAEMREKFEMIKAKTGKEVGLAVVLVGDDPASAIYVRNKIKACEEVGVKSYAYRLDKDTKEEDLADLVMKLNNDDNVQGILVQLPLPKHINSERIVGMVADEKDVDGFSEKNVGRLVLGKSCFRSCTPAGVMKLLEYYGIDVSGKRAVVIGRSNIVGKPMAMMLLEKNATVTICHSKTENIAEVTKQADILVAAVGRAHFVTADMIKEGAVVIDVGMNKLDGVTVGDVDFESVSKKASFITPVPGGVGPMTITMLMANTLKAAE
ncbi:MAG: bifunctional methylenetetrahydrofolate dehydrogenase/methenyltetrahydrofolate cyclohydrolase FolD [Clostridia bacterium]|nr:bifunctional methylenetetrahydrofolate dehydrogenase/methenyltetrahydrofolate cyclohydrolase FolD [Clostridia bacterium]